MEKIFANDITNKRLLSKICTQLILLSIKKQSKNGQKTRVDTFPKIYKWPGAI